MDTENTQKQRLFLFMKNKVYLFILSMTFSTIGFGIGLIPFSNFLLVVMVTNYILFLLIILFLYKRVIRLTKYYLFFSVWIISTASYGFIFASYVLGGEKNSPLEFTIFALLYGIAVMSTYFISYRHWDKGWNKYKDCNLTVLKLETAKYDVEQAFMYRDITVSSKRRKKLTIRDKVKDMTTKSAISLGIVIGAIALQLSLHGFSNLIFPIMSVLAAYAGILFLSYSVAGIYGTMKIREYEKALHIQIENCVNE